MSSYAIICGEFREWPSKEELAAVFRAAGLRINVGRYSIRFRDMKHFSIQEYGGDLGPPQIEGAAFTPETLAHEAAIVSKVLARADVVHRFEIYREEDGELVFYLHHRWPM